jgi:hypothetical protein
VAVIDNQAQLHRRASDRCRARMLAIALFPHLLAT